MATNHIATTEETLASLVFSVQAAVDWLDSTDDPPRPERAREVLITALRRAGFAPNVPRCAACDGLGSRHMKACTVAPPPPAPPPPEEVPPEWRCGTCDEELTPADKPFKVCAECTLRGHAVF